MKVIRNIECARPHLKHALAHALKLWGQSIDEDEIAEA
jgi:hypothetical protein